LKKELVYNLLLLTSCYFLNGQEMLSVDEAIKIALQKNYSVLTGKNIQEIAKAQNNAGAAGMSPTVALNANISSSNLNSYQEFNTGATQDRKGAKAFGTTATLNADWTVFDGLRMFAIKKRLDLSEGLSALQLKQQMENTIYEVILSYNDIVRINELIKAARQNLLLYEERRKVAQLRMEIGSDSKVELLLSKSGENTAKSAIIQLELQLLKAKTNLNLLLGRPVDTDFKSMDSIVVNYNPALEDLRKSTDAQNSSVLISLKNEMIFSQSIKEARSANLPFVTLNAAYLFTRNSSQAGFVFLNRQTGFNYGLTARWLLFNGGRNSKLVKERDLLALNQRYLTEQTRLQVDGLVYINYQAFMLSKKIVDMERLNMIDSKEVQAISLERYRIGKANLLETIETQKNLEDAQVRYINALYEIKKAETELLRANGSLIK
jgi:outer membrane protein